MNNNSIWMVRAGKNAAYAEDFIEQNLVGIGFVKSPITPPIDKAQLEQQIVATNPNFGSGKISNMLSQLKRFYEELTIGDNVMTYDPSQRLYFVGEIRSDVAERDHVLHHSRSVKWLKQVHRDSLSQDTRNTLGAIQSLFLVRDRAASEVSSQAIPIGEEIEPDIPSVEPPPSGKLDESADEVEGKAFELIDDRIATLDWEQLQDLVAEILRAMGFRAETSDKGPDRGVDITASPDGLGLNEPRIFVEVKHRTNTKMSSDQIRSFLGGRQQGDKCLYVSTGGFTKEARYEAERSNIPVTLIDLPKLRSLVLEHYENFTPAGRDLVPLQRIYWPIG